MSAKIKMYLVYAISFTAIFLFFNFLSGLFLEPESLMRLLLPVLLSIIVAPKLHVEQEKGTKKYGLKSIFTKATLWFQE
jgi:hypothetical protein